MWSGACLIHFSSPINGSEEQMHGGSNVPEFPKHLAVHLRERPDDTVGYFEFRGI